MGSPKKFPGHAFKVPIRGLLPGEPVVKKLEEDFELGCWQRNSVGVQFKEDTKGDSLMSRRENMPWCLRDCEAEAGTKPKELILIKQELCLVLRNHSNAVINVGLALEVPALRMTLATAGDARVLLDKGRGRLCEKHPANCPDCPLGTKGSPRVTKGKGQIQV